MKFRHGMVAPLIALFIGVVGFPLIYAFYLSVTDYRLTSRGTPKLVGADNYVATLRTARSGRPSAPPRRSCAWLSDWSC